MTNIIIIRDGIVDENFLCQTKEEALSLLSKYESLLDPNDHPNLEEILNRGYQRIATGAICISHPETYQEAVLDEEAANSAI